MRMNGWMYIVVVVVAVVVVVVVVGKTRGSKEGILIKLQNQCNVLK